MKRIVVSRIGKKRNHFDVSMCEWTRSACLKNGRKARLQFEKGVYVRALDKGNIYRQG